MNKDKCIIYVHGGSWTGGTPNEIDKYSNLFNKQFDIIKVDYKLIPKTTMTLQILQVTQAIKKVKDKYKKIYLLGFSAGAHLAIMAARKVAVDGVIAICPPVSFDDVPKMKYISLLLGFNNPITKASKDTTKTLLIEGTDDQTTLIQGARKYAQKQKNCTLIEVAGGTHSLSLINTTIQNIQKFLGKLD